jgi:hypothetical protein
MSPDALSISELQEGSDSGEPWEIPPEWTWQTLGISETYSTIEEYQ